MEIPKKNSSKELKSKLNQQDDKNSLTFESNLEIRAGKILPTWIKRYFVLLEGEIIIYTESKESKLIKGYILINKILNIYELESNKFSIKTNDETITLRAEYNGIKSIWIEKISSSLTSRKIANLDDKNSLKKSIKLFEAILHIDEKKNNLKSLDEKVVNLIKKYGYMVNEDEKVSKSLLIKYGIDELMNLNVTKILENIHHGFMYKKQKNKDKYDKKWFFLFSRNILFNKNNNKYNEYLEDKLQKDWLKFDTLYCFDYKSSKNIDNIFEEFIKMEDCIKIIKLEEDEKYIINLDCKESIYTFYCDYKFERDEWFKALIRSKNTAKIFKNSLTKHPKNMQSLYEKYLKNENECKNEMYSEMIKVTGDINKIEDFDIFEFTVDNLKNSILLNIDGCLNNAFIKIEFLKYYISYMNEQYLDIYRIFWDKFNLRLEDDQIIKMGLMLLNYYDEIKKFGVNDINILKNGNYLTKIYFKIIFPNILFEILKRIKFMNKETINNEGKYESEGPKELFEIFMDKYNKIKDTNNKKTFIYFLQILNMCIFQYCIGINCIISNRNIIVSDEFLITISNDTLNLKKYLDKFIVNLAESKKNIINEKEIKEGLHFVKVNNIINKIGEHAKIHLIYKHKEELEKKINVKKFLEMNIENIITESGKIYAKYKPKMNDPAIKAFYSEIVKLILSYYIVYLLINNKCKTNDIIEKIKKDRQTLFDNFKDLIGESLSNTTLEILVDIKGVLGGSQSIIINQIEKIRKYIGPAFTYSVAENLIDLRNDLDANLKKTHLGEIKQFLDKAPEDKKSSYFQILSLIKESKNDKKYNKLTVSALKYGSILIRTSEIFEDEPDKDNIVDIPEEEENYNIPNEQKSNEITLEKFLEEDEKDEIKEDFEKDIKPDFDGFFYEKSKIIYYFQIKNSCLYLYKDKNSKIALNKFLIQNMNILDEGKEDNKFLFKHSNENDKIYKFKCSTNEEKQKLIKAIIKASKKNKNEIIEEKKLNEIKIKERKRVIEDKIALKDFIKNSYIESQMIDMLNSGEYFPLKKIENTKQKKQKPKYF